jgi:hypothetical protein
VDQSSSLAAQGQDVEFDLSVARSLSGFVARSLSGFHSHLEEVRDEADEMATGDAEDAI